VHYDYALFLCHFGETLPLIKISGYAHNNALSALSPANKGVEYKFKMQKYAKITYQWQAQSALYFDFHGEPEGDTTGYFESYTIATAEKMEGSMTVPFNGIHGWYWKNTTDKAITVTLNTEGRYQVIGLLH
jgi:hypothetical protein